MQWAGWLLAVFTLATILLPSANASIFNNRKQQAAELKSAQAPFKASAQWNSQQINWSEVPAEWLTTFPDEQWWTTFNDPPLNQLMATALAQNPSLASFQLRITQADALAKATKSIMFPQVDFNGSYLLQQFAKDQFVFPLQGRTFHSAQTLLNVSYELDIWGKNWDSVKMAKLGVQAAKYAYASARNQLTSQVAASYFQLARLNAMVDAQQKILRIAESNRQHATQLFKFQQIPASQVDLAQQYVDQAKAELVGWQGLQRITAQQLRTLLGRPATEAAPIPVTPLAQLTLPEALATGVPSDLLNHRPDVARQQALITMAQLNASIAKKSLLPSLRLTAATGYAAVGGWNKLFDVSNISSFVSPAISQPIFRGGLLTNGLRLRRVEYEQALKDYQSVLLIAFQETENSLTQWQTSRQQLRDVSAQYLDVERQAMHARSRYEAGLTGQPDWLLPESQRLTAQKAVDTQKAQLLMDTVSVYKALGGGFEQNKPERRQTAHGQ